MTSSNPFFDSYDDSTSSDDESFSDEIDPHHFNAESDLIESLLNRDTLIVSSPKFDSLLEEFSGELAHIDLISPEIDEADFDPEEEIRLVEKLLFSSPRPPAKPPDDDGIYFDAKPDTGILTVKVVDDISEHYVFKPRILTTQPTLSPLLLSHQGFKAFKLISNFSESPMMIYGRNIPILDDMISPFPIPFYHSRMRDRFRLKTRLTKIKRFVVSTHAYPNIIIIVVMNKCDVRRFASSILVFVVYVCVPSMARIMKNLVHMVMSFVTRVSNP
ncbi:hypothetical protein Tco_1000390 [Tanacetum coccineum]